MVDEVEWILDRYHPEQLWLADDVFTIHHGWLDQYAAEMKRRGLRVPFECITRADRLNARVAAQLAELGCYRVWIGSESGSQRLLDAMERGVTVAQVRDAVAQLRENGIQTGMFFMWGYEGEELARYRSDLRTREGLPARRFLHHRLLPDQRHALLRRSRAQAGATAAVAGHHGSRYQDPRPPLAPFLSTGRSTAAQRNCRPRPRRCGKACKMRTARWRHEFRHCLRPHGCPLRRACGPLPPSAAPSAIWSGARWIRSSRRASGFWISAAAPARMRSFRGARRHGVRHRCLARHGAGGAASGVSPPRCAAPKNSGESAGSFDGAISNFGALNCVDDLPAVARALATWCARAARGHLHYGAILRVGNAVLRGAPAIRQGFAGGGAAAPVSASGDHVHYPTVSADSRRVCRTTSNCSVGRESACLYRHPMSDCRRRWCACSPRATAFWRACRCCARWPTIACSSW